MEETTVLLFHRQFLWGLVKYKPLLFVFGKLCDSCRSARVLSPSHGSKLFPKSSLNLLEEREHTHAHTRVAKVPKKSRWRRIIKYVTVTSQTNIINLRQVLLQDSFFEVRLSRRFSGKGIKISSPCYLKKSIRFSSI